MSDVVETKEKQEVKTDVPKSPAVSVPSTQGFSRGRGGEGGGGGGRFPMRRKNVRKGGRPQRARSEFDQKLINIRRVARVSSGGRRFSFSVAMILGNRRGSVGVGTGKGPDTASAIDKAMRSAKKNMIAIRTTPSSSIAYPVAAKFSSARIMLFPAPGRGMVAGGAVRKVLELAGIKDITSKIISPSKNSLNVARAAVAALASLGAVVKAPLLSAEKPSVENTKTQSK